MASQTVLNLQIVNASAKVLGKRAARDSDVEMDLSKPLPYPAPEAVVEAMRQRILQLENELHAFKKQKTTGGAGKSQQTSLALAGPSGSKTAASTAPATTARDAKADAKTIKTRSKSLFDQLKKAVKAEKYTNVVRTVKVEDHFSQADFELVFGNSGQLVQPTPTNKPKSTVWIKRYNGETDFAALFGEAYKKEQLKGWQWSVGNIFVGKGQKLGQVQLEIQSIEIQWSKNTEKVVLKVEICEEDMDLFARGGMIGGFW